MMKNILSILSFISLSSSLVAAQGANRRVYFNDNSCQGAATMIYNVYTPQIPCAAVTNDANPWQCETKSRLSPTLSSESTACHNVPNGEMTDAPWIATQGANRARVIPNVNYFFHNVFSGANECSIGTTANLNSIGYVADGNCYASEPDTYYRALCDGTKGTILKCWGAGCTNCEAPIEVPLQCSNGPVGWSNGYCITGEKLLNGNINGNFADLRVNNPIPNTMTGFPNTTSTTNTGNSNTSTNSGTNNTTNTNTNVANNNSTSNGNTNSTSSTNQTQNGANNNKSGGLSIHSSSSLLVLILKSFIFYYIF